MTDDEVQALLSTIQDQIRQLQDVVAGGPEGVQAQWNDQGNYATALSDLKAEVARLRAMLNPSLEQAGPV